ncbi:MAG: hypothetical protein PHD11_02255 [Bacteroidales bacterium]|nr:hypothetical protein [Bacteroidales bacterium]MDD4669890.1 hypothetical protein [Bacteroidales bacterium]
MKVLLAAIIVIGICVLAMCVTIIFKKDGKFPDGEISRNKELRKKGIVCAKEEEMKLWGKNKKRQPEHSDCSGCAFFEAGCTNKQLRSKKI